MGRILVIGKAERKVVADRCRIIISIDASDQRMISIISFAA